MLESLDACSHLHQLLTERLDSVRLFWIDRQVDRFLIIRIQIVQFLEQRV